MCRLKRYTVEEADAFSGARRDANERKNGLASWEYDAVRRSAFDALCTYLDATIGCHQPQGGILNDDVHLLLVKKKTFEYEHIF
jgi:hypothetical protein